MNGRRGAQFPRPCRPQEESDFIVSTGKAMRVLNRDVKRYLLWTILQKENGQREVKRSRRQAGKLGRVRRRT